MLTITRRLPHLLFLLALVLTFLGTGSLEVAAKPGSVPGPAISQCNQGGWATLARSGLPTASFTSQQDCATFVAKGGTAVTRAAITLGYSDPMGRWERFYGVGLEPGGPITITNQYFDGRVDILSDFFWVNPDGTFEGWSGNLPCDMESVTWSAPATGTGEIVSGTFVLTPCT